jgi:hypothetical protein
MRRPVLQSRLQCACKTVRRLRDGPASGLEAVALLFILILLCHPESEDMIVLVTEADRNSFVELDRYATYLVTPTHANHG